MNNSKSQKENGEQVNRTIEKNLGTLRSNGWFKLASSESMGNYGPFTVVLSTYVNNQTGEIICFSLPQDTHENIKGNPNHTRVLIKYYMGNIPELIKAKRKKIQASESDSPKFQEVLYVPEEKALSRTAEHNLLKSLRLYNLDLAKRK